MSKKKIINESFREQIAKELGVYDTVKIEGWGGASTKDGGNIITKSVEKNQRNFNR